MGLAVVALRSLMLLLNIYETFKTLKAPPLSARHGGRTSVRAQTQRKRDMKGCLAVWIVWCCFAAYERMLEPIARVFIPFFYSELKSILIIFLIVTRARGAEPIFLHLIRPFMKPYTSTLDSILDFSLLLGDIAAYAVMRPVRRVQEWWDSDETLWQLFSLGGGSDSIEQTQIPNIAEITATAARALEAPPPVERSASPPLPASPGRNPFYLPPEQADGLKPPFPQSVEAVDSAQNPDGWYPPPPAYHDIASGENGLQPDHRQRGTSRSPSPGESGANNVWRNAEGAASQPSVASSASSSSSSKMPAPLIVDPWRTYEPFPAAYPLTPLAAGPSILPAFRPQSTTAAVPSITEVMGEPIERPATAPSLTDRKPSPKPQEKSEGEGKSESEEDTAGEEEEEEDSFNVTLRTPHVPLPQPMIFNVSDSSAQSRSTALTTVHQESLRTSIATQSDSDSDSDSSSSSAASTSSSSIGGGRHKRSSSGTSYDARTQMPAYERIWVGNTVVGVRPRQVTPPQIPSSLVPGRPPMRTALDTDTSGSSDESEIEDDRMIPGIKRPRAMKMVSASDSAARMGTHGRSGSLGGRPVAGGSATRPPVRPTSGRSASVSLTSSGPRNNASSASSSYYYSSASAQASHAPRRPVRS